MYYNSQSMLSPERSSFNSLKGVNERDSMLSLFPDDDSGFNSTLRSRSRSGLYTSDDYNTSPAMSRSRSMTRLPMTSSQDLGDPMLNQSLQSLRVRPFEHSLRHMKDNLDDSENRRIVLVHKLKEAQETLELQNDRLNRIEGTAKTNSVLVDDLKYKEKEYRDKINQLEQSEEQKAMLRQENNRLRDEMQARIDKLDYALRSLQAQHQVSETENIKRSSLLEQSTTALALLENENTRLKKDKDALRQEILVAKEAMELTREKFTPIESENKNLKNEIERIKQENDRVAHKAEMSNNKLKDLKELTETMKEENEKLASSWKTLSEEKQKLVAEIDRNQDNHREARSRVTNLSAERDRLFTEKMELNNKVQQLSIDKEQVEKLFQQTKIALEEQIAEQEEELARIRKGVKRKDEERRLLEETIHDSKNNYDDLYKELANTRAYYERSLEQISVLENNKQLAVQQLELAEHEKERLRQDNERLREVVERKSGDLKNERQQLEEAVLDLKADLRELRQEKSKAEDRCHELEIKLQKANDDVKEIATMKQEEIDSLKSTCDRLSAGSTKKDTELQNMSEKMEQIELQNERLRDELRGFKDECENLSDQVEDIKKLKDENRRLHQEKAENEQVIKLLETQKDVLSKSADSSLEKLKDIDKLTDKIEQYRHDNEHLRNRINELEKVRDSLVAQKEELLANSELIYKKPQLEDLEAKIDELRDANKQLREINEQVNEKAEALQQENVTLKDAVGGDGSVVPRVELERLTREKERLQSELDYVKKEHENLEERHQRFIIEYGHEGSETMKDKETIEMLNKEKEALEKTVALINGQMLLVEGGKRRLDDVVDDLQTEIVSLRQQLEEAEKKAHGPEVEALQEEVNILNEQLDEAKYEQDKQRRLIQTLKDDIEEERNKKPTQIRSSLGKESLDDVGTELRDMRGELHKLMGVIESKDHAIETLENQLRTSKEDNIVKQQAMSDLQHLVSDLENKNTELKKSVDGVRHSVEEKLLSPRRSSPSPPPRKVEDGSGPLQSGDSTTILRGRRAVSQDRGREILRRLQPAESTFKRESQSQTRSSTESDVSEGIEVVPGQYGSKFISKQIKRSHSEKGGDRLQSLISKYRGYSDGGSHQERKIKPLSVSPASSKMGLVTKGRSFGPAAPKTDKEVSGVEYEPAVLEVLPSSSSPLLNSVSSAQKCSPSLQDSSANDNTEASDVGKQDMNVQTGVGGAAKDKADLDGKEAVTEEMEEESGSEEEESDSEQKDIDNLIDRSAHPRPLLSVSPPKITSKVIGDLLKTMPSASLSDYPDTSPGTSPLSPMSPLTPLNYAPPDSL